MEHNWGLIACLLHGACPGGAPVEVDIYRVICLHSHEQSLMPLRPAQQDQFRLGRG